MCQAGVTTREYDVRLNLMTSRTCSTVVSFIYLLYIFILYTYRIQHQFRFRSEESRGNVSTV